MHRAVKAQRWEGALTHEEASRLAWLRRQKKYHFDQQKELQAKIYGLERLAWDRLANREAAE